MTDTFHPFSIDIIPRPCAAYKNHPKNVIDKEFSSETSFMCALDTNKKF